MKGFEEDNKQNPEMSEITELPQNNIQNEDSQDQHSLDKKPLLKRKSCYIFRKSIVFIGVTILLLCPVIFFRIIVFLANKGDETPEQEAIKWALGLTLTGWLISEIGLIISKPSAIVQILARIAIYLYVFIGLVLLGIIKIASEGRWP
jgi:hypothetical protein